MHPPLVAHEVAVDLEVGPRPEPDDGVVAGVDRDVAALRAPRADARRAIEVPRARLVQEILRDERTHRAEVHHVAGPGVVELAVGEDADRGPVAALRDVEHAVLRHVVHEADAPGAEDAAVGHVEDVGPELLDGVVPLGVVVVPAGGPAFLEGVVLELALARLVADRAVERVVGQEELQDALARLLRGRAVDVHHLAVGHGGDAGGHQLGRLLDLHQAHAADGRRRQRRVIAVVRDEDAGLLGGLDDRGALRDAHLGPVDRDGHALGHRVRPLRAPAGARR